MVACLVWGITWATTRTQTAGKLAGILSSAWLLFRLDSTRVLKFLFSNVSLKGRPMNLQSMIENGLTALINKQFPNQTPAQAAIVTAAVTANTQLALLVVEIEGAKLLATKYPQLATALQQIVGITA